MDNFYKISLIKLITIINSIVLAFAIFAFVFISADVSHRISMMILALIIAGNFVMIKKGWLIVARIIPVAIILAAPVLTLFIKRNIDEGQFLGYTVMSNFVLVLIALLFDKQKETGWFWGATIFCFVFYAGIDFATYYLSDPRPNIDFLLTHSSRLYFGRLFIMLCTFLLIIYFQNLITSYRQQNEMLLRDIQRFNWELEQKVQEQTGSIEEKKEKIIKAVFAASHSLRAPLTTIMTITDLMKSEPNAVPPEIIVALHQKSKEMDDVLVEMVKKLTEER